MTYIILEDSVLNSTHTKSFPSEPHFLHLYSESSFGEDL